MIKREPSMHLIDPDVIAAAKGLSFGAAGFAVFVGLLLWSLGWRWHRFWVVFGITLGAGLIGLTAGKSAGGSVMIVGVLLAVAAGMLALELAKILSFVSGGAAAWIAAQAVLPQVQELWAVFLAGGLLGVVLYQLWTMLLTSLLGILVIWHAGFVLLGQILNFDASKWVGEHAVALNGGVIAVAVIGVLVQTRTAEKKPVAEEEADSEDEESKPKKEKKKKSEKSAETAKAA